MTDADWGKLCNSCNTQSCCKSFVGANLLPSELERITKHVDHDRFVEIVEFNKIPTPVIKNKPDVGECYFWDSDKEHCSIYDVRPFDCKLFPFDIHEIDGKYMWVINNCNPDADWSWTESILNDFEADESFPELVRTLKSYSYPESTRNDLYEIKILRPVKINSL